MPFKCSVPGCYSNYDSHIDFLKCSVFLFPRDEILRQEWIKAMGIENFKVHKTSRVCELHFEPSQILREASAYDPKTGRTLTAPLKIPHLRKGAVPTLRLPTPGAVFKKRMDPRSVANLRRKNQPKEGTEETVESQLAKLLQVGLGTEFQNVVETPLYTLIVKEETSESVYEVPELKIEKVLGAQELLSSTSSSSSGSSSSSSSLSSSSTSSISPAGHSPPVPENGLSIASPDSTTVDQTPTTHVSDKPAPKRKTSEAEPDTSDATPDAPQATLCRCPKRSLPSEGINKPHPPTGTAKKSVERSTSPTRNGEDAARGMFQSLLDNSENNPLFGSRTTERPGDLFDVFADFIADKLREMDLDDCAYSLRAILDVVFKAGRVQHDSGVQSDISNPNLNTESSDHE